MDHERAVRTSVLERSAVHKICRHLYLEILPHIPTHAGILQVSFPQNPIGSRERNCDGKNPRTEGSPLCRPGAVPPP